MKTGYYSRRQFLTRSLMTGAGVALPTLIPGSVFGAEQKPPPSERLNVGVIGIGAMGGGHLRHALDTPSVQVLAVCEVDQVRRDRAQQRADEAYGPNRCKSYVDYREVLARPDIDAVLIATPDHWHTMMSIDAAKAGKDVYCEKPISISIMEGRRLAETVRRTGCVFQTGTQYRSIPVVRQVCDFVRAGGLGKVKSVFTLWNNVGLWLGSERFRPYAKALDLQNNANAMVPLDFVLPAEPVPAGLDWPMWVGPAQWHDYNRLYHINPSPGVVPWSFCDEFGAASVTWHHSHSADVLQYALGMERSGPVEIIPPGAGPYPTLTCKYANGTLLHLVEGWGQVLSLYHALPNTARLAGNFGALFVGERGWVTSMSTGGPIEGGPEEIFKELNLTTRQVNIGTNNHHANWYECIRTRKQPSCDEELGHRSASLGHLTIIGYRMGRSLKWDPVREEFIGDEIANRLRGRTFREPWRI